MVGAGVRVMQKKTGERVEPARTVSRGRSIIGRRATRPTIGSSRGSLLDGHRLLLVGRSAPPVSRRLKDGRPILSDYLQQRNVTRRPHPAATNDFFLESAAVTST
jgi:hypothetical protein